MRAVFVTLSAGIGGPSCCFAFLGTSFMGGLRLFGPVKLRCVISFPFPYHPQSYTTLRCVLAPPIRHCLFFLGGGGGLGLVSSEVAEQKIDDCWSPPHLGQSTLTNKSRGQNVWSSMSAAAPFPSMHSAAPIPIPALQHPFVPGWVCRGAL